MDHDLRRPQESPWSFARKAGGIVGKLLTGKGDARVDGAKRLLAYALWSRPRSDIDRYLQVAPRLPDKALEQARLFADRVAMLKACPRNGIVVEVGTWRGDFSRHIAEQLQPAEFHLVDLDFGPLDEDGVRSRFKGELAKHAGDSATTVRELGRDFADMIYVDADHSYEGVRRDLAAAHFALKPGGTMMCNDYTNWCSYSVEPYGVARAVNEFVADQAYTVAGLALEPGGLYDILLVKPGK